VHSFFHRFAARHAAFLVLSTIVVLSGGCGSGGGSPKGALTGTVTDVDGRSVAGAIVEVNGQTATSLSNGTFTISDIGEGFKKVTATNTIDGKRWSGETFVDLVGDYQNRSLNIVVSDEQTQGSLEGTVIGPSGLLLENAKVFIGGPLGSTLAITDRNGNFTANRLTPGVTYTMTASLAGFVNDTKTAHVAANQATQVSFALERGTNQGTIPAPTNLFAQSWTVADTVTRSASKERGVFEWLKKVYREKRGLKSGPQAKSIQQKPSGRSTPSGSVVEVDLFWDFVSYTDLFGYAIKRSFDQNNMANAEVTAVLRDPLTSLFFDVDPILTPDVPTYYTVHALDTIGFPESGAVGPPSNVATAIPFEPLRAQSPVGGAVVSGNPTFRWTAVNGAQAYQVYVWDEFPALFFDPSRPNEPAASQPIWPADLNNPGNTVVLAPGTSLVYQGPALQAGRTYYWMVVAMDSANPANITTLSASQIAKFVAQ
jgi:hypothetical protein